MENTTELIESIDVKSLETYLYSDKKSLPTYPGIYFIGFASDDLWYVGQSQNIKNRHKSTSHHRHHQLKAAEKLYNKPLQIWCWQAPIRLGNKLDNIERALIKKFDPRQNDTPNPNTKKNRNSREPVYVQLESMKYLEEPCELEEDSSPGLYATRKKLPYLKRAFKDNAQCILISSIPTKQVMQTAFKNYKKLLSPDGQWKMQTTLYFLEYVFRPTCIDETEDTDGTHYYIYTDRNNTFVRQLYLNEFDDFKDFRKRYLVMGLINCAAHPFTNHLLQLAQG